MRRISFLGISSQVVRREFADRTYSGDDKLDVNKACLVVDDRSLLLVHEFYCVQA